jgi:phospholipid-binding lipoprotein MlaA
MLAGEAACSRAPPTPSAQSAPPALAVETPEPRLAGAPPPEETAIATAGGRDAALEARAAATVAAPAAITIASAQASAVVGASDEFPDPLQRLNPPMFHIDQDVRRVVLSRTSSLRAPSPTRPVQQGLGQAISYLDEPGTRANQTLQRKPARALRTAKSFLISSTLGLAGLFDDALKFGLRHARPDYSQAVASYRAGPGA